MLDSELVVLDEAAISSEILALDSDLLIAEESPTPSRNISPTEAVTAGPRRSDKFVYSSTMPGVQSPLRGVRKHALINDRYQIIEELEAGGMGQVFIVFDRRSEQTLALKIGLDPDPRGDYHLKREFRAVKHIRHRNLVKLHELGLDRHKMLLYYTMELIRGTTFLKYVRRPGKLENDDWIKVDLDRLRHALAQLADGIQALHAHERLHRDLKPSNVMVSLADERVVILDFGLVDYTDHMEGTLSQEGPVGTPQYMAPEQTIASRGCVPATDWYAVGVMIYEAVTGRLPIAGRTLFELISNKQLADPKRMSTVVRGVPAALDDLVARLLDRDPSKRPNAAELRAWCHREQDGDVFEVDAKMAPAETTVLLGRSSAVAKMCHAFNAVLAKQPRSLMVHGPSGTGKSALIRHVLRTFEVNQPDVLILRGICYEHETVPYRAFDQVIEELARYLASVPEPTRRVLFPARVSHVLDLFPVLQRVPGIERLAEDSEYDGPAKNQQEHRRRAFYELKHLLFNVASHRSLVVFLDDLHASDSDSAHLLSEILAPPYQPPMLLIGAYRSHASSDTPLLLDFFNLIKTSELQNIEFLELGPLSHTHAVRVAAQLLSDIGIYRPQYAEILAHSCAGNSALMEQVVGLIHRDHAGFSAEVERLGEAAFSLGYLVSRRLAGLSTDARWVLAVLAVGAAPVATSVIAQIVSPTENLHTLCSQLADNHLVYTHERDGVIFASCINQPVRDAILATRAPGDIQGIHLSLASAYMDDLPASAKACAHHLIASGNQEQAVEFLETAALAARGALAFEQAADLYRVALKCAPDSYGLELKLAEALELAGHSAEASHYLLAAASRAKEKQRVELIGRAVSQMLISGELGRGLETLASLLPMIDLDFPQTPQAVMLAFTRSATLLKIHPLTFCENTRFQISSQLLVRIDTCWHVGRGLLLVDPIFAGYLLMHSAVLALAAGEPRRIARALALVGMLLANRDAELGYRILERAEEVAHGIGDQYAIGLSSICMGLARRSEGQWAEGLAMLNFGVEHLRTHAVGVAWEHSLALTGTFSALEALGDFPTLEARIPALMRQAGTTGDVHTSLLVTLYSGLLLLARDRVNEADVRISDALARWSRLDRYLAHMHALKLSVYIDLYRDKPERAWDRMTKLPEDVMADHSQYLSFRVGRTDWHVLRGRTALARAKRAANPQVLLKTCARIARWLARHHDAYTQGSSAAMRAGIANLTGHRSETLAFLREAEGYFRAARMELHVACVQRRLGILLEGQDGADQIAASERVFSRIGVKNPACWVRIYTPGLEP